MLSGNVDGHYFYNSHVVDTGFVILELISRVVSQYKIVAHTSTIHHTITFPSAVKQYFLSLV